MQIQLIQHAPFENPGAIMSWAIERGYQISSTHTYKGEKLPDSSEIDFLIIMGGPQSATKLEIYQRFPLKLYASLKNTEML
jgi:GMP synthase (glutamine-hydrolysing)